MKRKVFRGSAFVRSAKNFVKSRPQAESVIDEIIEQLENDAFEASLRTHKLKGKLAGLYSCSAGYDLRLVFKFMNFENEEVILLLSVGTHGEVY